MKHLLLTVLATSLAFTSSFVTTIAHAQEEEIAVLMFGMPLTNGLRELADDFQEPVCSTGPGDADEPVFGVINNIERQV